MLRLWIHIVHVVVPDALAAIMVYVHSVGTHRDLVVALGQHVDIGALGLSFVVLQQHVACKRRSSPLLTTLVLSPFSLAWFALVSKFSGIEKGCWNQTTCSLIIGTGQPKA